MDVDDSRGAIGRANEKAPAVGAEEGIVNGLLGTVLVECLPGGDVPDARGLVTGSGRQQGPIAAEAGGPDDALVSAFDRPGLAIRERPEVDVALSRDTDECFQIRSKDGTDDCVFDSECRKNGFAGLGFKE